MINHLIQSPLQLALLLMVIFQVKHFLADFVLQSGYMVMGKAAPGWGFILPLTIHCTVQALFTLLICLWVEPSFWWLAAVDFGAHFVMDRIKSGPQFLGRFNDPKRPSFWVSLGADQMVHHLTSVYIIWVLVAK